MIVPERFNSTTSISKDHAPEWFSSPAVHSRPPTPRRPDMTSLERNALRNLAEAIEQLAEAAGHVIGADRVNEINRLTLEAFQMVNTAERDAGQA